ncbi:MAG: 2-C-methyl-D-erythritol 2,4-cyclodiphosphate synthase [Clostridia bacterium]|nr:2-C-methyl-D-erythritol 2,4-cyclodiphosphate synthase [Clostridia bacterium]
MADLRIGHGYDVHKLVEGRKLILGGVEIPHTLGLLGHSDADVLIHALMDAMLGALALGDIGKHFPDTSGEFKDISSMILLERVCGLVKEKGYEISNADITVIAQKPKLLPHIPQMVKNICDTCGCSEDFINVKATTEEQLGFTGRQEGISAHAVVIMKKV